MTQLAITPSQRRSRMHRTSTGKRLELTSRDLEIFNLLTRYRYLRSTYIHSFVGGNRTKLVERLGHLYHEGGYLDRPEQQWESINARYAPAVYELGEAGRSILETATAEATQHGRRETKARRYFHELMVCEIVASIELATRAVTGQRFITWEEILASPKMPDATLRSPNPLAISAPVTYTRPRTGDRQQLDGRLVPDAVFGIEYRNEDKKSYRFFALEADRGTEPIIRGALGQSSYLRKILQYRDVACKALYRSHWGLPNLVVLNVTASERRLHGLLRLVEEIAPSQDAGVLLFRAAPEFGLTNSARLPMLGLMSSAWQRAGRPPLVL